MPASDQSLPVAVIGVAGVGRWTLQALLRTEGARVVGLADKDPAVAERASREFHVPAFADNRSLLAEARPAAVFMAVPPKAAPDIVGACADRGVHVWKEMPLARNLAEGASMVRQMEQAGLKFAVGTQRRFATGYRHAWQLRRMLGETFLARGHYLFHWGDDLAWRGDKASAGGGAMLELGYHLVDLMVWMLGLPEEVYGVTGVRSRQGLPLYDTDDTAAAILRYPPGAMATVVASRASGPVSEEFNLHGSGGSLAATGETCLLRDPDGNVLDHSEDNADALAPFIAQSQAFVAAVAGSAKRYECSARENLLNLAVIEAAYLSDRTGQPESPGRLLRPHDFEPDDCLTLRPVEDVDETTMYDFKTPK